MKYKTKAQVPEKEETRVPSPISARERGQRPTIRMHIIPNARSLAMPEFDRMHPIKTHPKPAPSITIAPCTQNPPVTF